MNRDTRGDVGLDLSGQVALVTGAGRGIGKASAVRLAAAGARVLVADRDLSAADGVATEIRASGDRADALTVDVSNRASVDALFQAGLDLAGRLDILVNNAGIAPSSSFLQTTEEEWDTVLAVNLTGAFHCSQLAVPLMQAQGYGRIVNIASLAGLRTSMNASISYTVSKAGLLGFTRHLALQVAGDGITVNAVCPGMTTTDTFRGVGGVAETAGSKVPIGRVLDPDDQARAVLFFASDMAAAVTGTALPVDGGSLLGWP